VRCLVGFGVLGRRAGFFLARLLFGVAFEVVFVLLFFGCFFGREGLLPHAAFVLFDLAFVVPVFFCGLQQAVSEV